MYCRKFLQKNRQYNNISTFAECFNKFEYGILIYLLVTVTLRTILVQSLELCVVVCIFYAFIERWIFFDGKNNRTFQLSV